jgi:IgA Peptidase M64
MTLLTNGPTARRINVVLLSEGYQSNQLGQFLTDANTVLGNLLSTAPLSEYSNYFNAFAISVASVNSGSSRAPDHPGVLNTYFNSTYNSYGVANLLTIPPNNWDTNSSHGNGKVLNLLTNLMPDYDLIVMVVNDTTQGGSGSGEAGLSNNLPLIVVSINSSFPDTVAHELGHTFGGLADEYTSAFQGFVPVEKPNVTAQTNRALIRWNAWIAGTTPVPTPPILNYYGEVGLFEGAEYQSAGWYRPKIDCRMNHLGLEFCEVCSEQLVKAVYALVRGIDVVTPVATNLSTFSTQAVAFAVSPMQPATHSLSIQWYTNGTAIAGATGSTFQVLPGLLGDGIHKVKVVVSDLTSLVRNDLAGLLRSSNTWTLNVSLNNLSLIAPGYLSAGGFRFTVTGSAPQGFVIQASTNLSDWAPLSTNSLTGGRFDFTNGSPGNMQNRFYRALSPP